MKIYTVKEAAKILKVNPKTVRKYINDGKLEASKLGNRFRIKEGDLENFFDANKDNKLNES